MAEGTKSAASLPQSAGCGSDSDSFDITGLLFRRQRHIVLGATFAGMAVAYSFGAYVALALGVGLALGLVSARIPPLADVHKPMRSDSSPVATNRLGERLQDSSVTEALTSTASEDTALMRAISALSLQVAALETRLGQRLDDLSSRMHALEQKGLGADGDPSERLPTTTESSSMRENLCLNEAARKAKESEELRRHAKEGHLKDLATMLAKGVDPNGEGADGHTALTLAAQHGHTECVDDLLMHGANVEARAGDLSQTALMLAAKEGHTGTVRALLRAGADVNATDFHGWTALQRAADAGHADAVDALLAEGADVTNSDYAGATALHRAGEHGYTRIVRALLDAGAEWLAQDNGQATPLHWAAFNGRDEVVRLLLQRGGAGPDHLEARNNFGRTPLHDASHKNYPSTVRLLLEAGALTSVRDDKGLTPIDVAASPEVKQAFGL